MSGSNDQPTKDDKPSIGHAGYNSQENPATQGKSTSSAKVGPTPQRSDESNDKLHSTLQQWKTVLEIVGIFFAIGYAVVTFLQWHDSSRNFRRSERAWVSFRIVGQIFEEGKPLAIPAEFSNTGRTPAVKVKTCQIAELVESTQKDVDISCPDTARSPGFTVIFPGQRIGRLSNAVGSNPKAPGITPDGILTKELMDQIRSGQRDVFLYGRVDYRDVFGEPHWIKFCSAMQILPPSPGGLPETHNWVACQNGNDTDSNY